MKTQCDLRAVFCLVTNSSSAQSFTVTCGVNTTVAMCRQAASRVVLTTERHGCPAVKVSAGTKPVCTRCMHKCIEHLNTRLETDGNAFSFRCDEVRDIASGMAMSICWQTAGNHLSYLAKMHPCYDP